PSRLDAQRSLRLARPPAPGRAEAPRGAGARAHDESARARELSDGGIPARCDGRSLRGWLTPHARARRPFFIRRRAGAPIVCDAAWQNGTAVPVPKEDV